MDYAGYRRRIRIKPEAGLSTVWMEDDFHHFGVTVAHQDGVITAVRTEAPRHPWTTCPAAGAFLDSRMRGVPLAEAATVEDQRQHCTHIYDIFVVAAAHAYDDAEHVYDIRVSDAVAGVMLAELDLDGRRLLAWRLGGQPGADEIPSGDREAFDNWTRSLPAQLIEAGRMLRRGVFVSAGRHNPWGAVDRASELGLSAVCYTFQPERSERGLRMHGSSRDFSENPEELAAGEPITDT